MKIWYGALCATAGVIACMQPAEREQLGVDEAEAIGICGANADPVTGVMCHYSYTPGPALQGGRSYYYSSYETFENNGLDYVRCKYDVSCLISATPKSDGGTTCISTIGTGCNEGNTWTTTTEERLLPAGTTEAQIADFCRYNVYPTDGDLNAACTALNHVVEQYEDLCCVPRPAPNPAPGAE